MKLIPVYLLFFSSQCFSQATPASLTSQKRSSTHKAKIQEVVIKQNDSYSTGNTKTVPPVVLQDFNTNFTTATNVSWFVNGKWCTVNCNFNEQTVIVKYTPEGQRLFTRKTYSLDKLDQKIVDLLNKEVGADFIVKYITELEHEGKFMYTVNLSNEDKWMTVKFVSNQPGELVMTGKQVF